MTMPSGKRLSSCPDKQRDKSSRPAPGPAISRLERVVIALASVAVGLVVEYVAFARLEAETVRRWGMVRG